jgi:Meckel syndrome type 1 protein
MEKTSKRGKIPQQDWPSIISRYEAGETLASIARTYDCSPPAISYIVSRTRARGSSAEVAGPRTDMLTATEPQLVKAQGSLPIDEMADAESMHALVVKTKTPTPVEVNTPASAGAKTLPLGEAKTQVPVEGKTPALIEALPSAPAQGVQSGVAERSADTPNPAGKEAMAIQPSSLHPEPADPVVKDDRTVQHNDEASRDTRSAAVEGTRGANAVMRTPESTVGSQTGERRTLHLSLPQSNGAAPAPAHTPPQNTPGSQPTAQHAATFGHALDGRPGPHPQGGQPGSPPPPRQRSLPPQPYASANVFGAVRDPAGAPDQSLKARDNGGFIDRALRERIDEDIAAFLAAFDAALDHDTSESRTELREATDRLLRAGARTRIELERLEARIPLGSREASPRSFPAFRPR